MRRGLASSRERAQEDVAAGRVLVDGVLADKPARLVLPDDAIVLTGEPPRFVSRGGAKLDAALDRFVIDVCGSRALDAGASTGGFTDCLLQRGASEVIAVDVGYGQLHERLRADLRVTVLDRLNIRTGLVLETIGTPVDLVVADLSFISLTLVIEPLLAISSPQADLVLLVKPQFEAGREQANKGKGIIGDPDVWHRAILDVVAACENHGAIIMECMVSPITGAEGNVEFPLHVRAPGAHHTKKPSLDLIAAIGEARAMKGF